MSLETTQNITLDFTVPRIKNIRCVEDDRQSRIIKIFVTNNGEAYPLDKSSMIARYKIHKPDHTYIYNELSINDDGTVTMTLSDQATAIPGILRSELQISDSENGRILSTMPFNIIVEKSVCGNKEIESKNESDVINDMICHLVDYNNPHEVTKSQVGLGNADNTSDRDKPVSTAQQAAFDKKVDKTTVATASTLGLIKSGADITVDSSGNVTVHDNSHKHTISNISGITATENEINVLDGITATTTELNYTDGVTGNIQVQLNAKAPLASPVFTGTPKAPTASAGTSTTQLATTEFVTTGISSHDTLSTAHSDIRELITRLTTRLNALADSDDTTLDQLSEIVSYIKSNRTLIENVTTNKVNVADIVDNLTTSAANKPLSSKQGKVLKDLLEALTSAVENKLNSALENALEINENGNLIVKGDIECDNIDSLSRLNSDFQSLNMLVRIERRLKTFTELYQVYGGFSLNNATIGEAIAKMPAGSLLVQQTANITNTFNSSLPYVHPWSVQICRPGDAMRGYVIAANALNGDVYTNTFKENTAEGVTEPILSGWRKLVAESDVDWKAFKKNVTGNTYISLGSLSFKELKIRSSFFSPDEGASGINHIETIILYPEDFVFDGSSAAVARGGYISTSYNAYWQWILNKSGLYLNSVWHNGTSYIDNSVTQVYYR
ncbi:MAG: phage baseplate upper protein [Clostridium sp.]|nr:phage baseplate upper protein [Clostridium sp.]